MKDNLKYLKLNLFLFLLLIISTLVFSVDASAANRDMFCSKEEIQNFEDAGYDKNAVLYFKSDIIYSVYSSFSDPIYFDDEEYIFSIDKNYMTVGHIGEDGFRYVDSYGKLFQMYDYKDACILKINENIPVKDKLDTYITDSGVKIVNDYSDCFESSENIVVGNICSLMSLSHKLSETGFQFPVLSILTGMIVLYAICIILFVVSGVFKKW